MTNQERREIVSLLELAADLAHARGQLDPAWPAWRKRLFWQDLEPKIQSYKARVKTLTGSYVAL